MRFAPTTEQLDLAGALREAFADADGWTVLQEMDVFGLLLPESMGGAESDLSMLTTVLAEVGYACVPGPVVDTLAFAPGLLVAAGLDDVGAAVAEGAKRCGTDLHGTGLVPAEADVVLSGGAFGRGAVRVHTLDRAAGEPVATVDPYSPLARLPSASGHGIATVDDPTAVDLAWQTAVVGASAQLVGLARRMLDLTVGYAAERQQFGAPIGSFQAVKHHLADVALAVEFAAPVVASAAVMLDGARGSGSGAHGIPPEVRGEVSAAKVLASDAALLAARRGIQCHGAIGYTTEYELHRQVKRAWALAASWGTADEHRDVVAGIVIPTF